MEELPDVIEALGERRVTPVLISEKLDGVLIGVLKLEALALKVNPASGRVERSEHLLGALPARGHLRHISF